MSKTEILAELQKLTPTEREEVRQRLAELDEEQADSIAHERAKEIEAGKVSPKTHAEVFRNARAALK